MVFRLLKTKNKIRMSLFTGRWKEDVRREHSRQRRLKRSLGGSKTSLEETWTGTEAPGLRAHDIGTTFLLVLWEC